MLSIAAYEHAYIDSSRQRVSRELDAFDDLVASAAESGGDRVRTAIATLEPRLCNHLVLVLDEYFCHRQRGKEGKDGNPLNEVRVLANSIMVHDGVLTSDPAIRLDPAKSVLGIEPGAQIVLSADDVRRLCEAFFAEIEARFG